jgi:putative hydrolase of the HAD superfamily
VRAVLFDVGGTLLNVHPSVGEVYAATAADHGIRVTADHVQRAFPGAWERSLERSHARGYRTSDTILRAEWLEIVRDTFGSSVPADKLDRLFGDLYERFVSAAVWKIVPGIHQTIDYLRSRGIRLGILSNWDSRLPRLLKDLQIEDSFDFVVVSHGVGFEKPHSAMFDEALRLARTDPGCVLHVGDSYGADIVPARRLGLRTLWVAPASKRALHADSGEGVGRLPAEPLPLWSELLLR